MNDATRDLTARAPPARGLWSVLMLLALVLAITAQLVTGFAMMAGFGPALLTAHVIGGVAALALTAAEWLWLCSTRAGRYRLKTFVASRRSGPAEWSEAAFLLVATVTVVFGALLASALYLGVRLPFAAFFNVHRSLAILVAVLYLVHTLFAMHRAGRRR